MHVNRHLTLLVFLLFTIISVVLPSACDEPRGSISGLVRSQDGAPAADTIVRAERRGYPAAVFWVEADGSFTLTNIHTGTWTIEYYSEHGNGLGRETVRVGKEQTANITFTIGAGPVPSGMDKLINFPRPEKD
jgi:hypothetical protein